MISLSSRNSLPPNYPFPAISDQLLQSIDTAIKVAWSNIGSKINLKTLNEEHITAYIQGELQDILENGNIPGFSRVLIHSINRESSLVSYDQKSLKKQPDLNVTFMELSPGLVLAFNNALFIECKIIDHSNQQTTYKYITDGIFRFVDGQYAWATRQAIMIAYVKGQKKPLESMKKVFLTNKNNQTVQLCAPHSNQYKVAYCKPVPETIRTTHIRHWKHPKLGAPGNLEIMHIWLDI